MFYLIFTLLFAACAPAGQLASLSPTKSYRKSLPITVNGKSGAGVMTVAQSSLYAVTLYPPANAEGVMVTSCNRQVFNIRRERPSIWGKDKPIVFNLKPMAGIETLGNCYFEITTLDMDGNNGSALIAIENEKLDATLYCNGEIIEAEGVSLCQSKTGLTQRVIFNEEVAADRVNDLCPALQPLETMVGFDVEIGSGLCAYIFKGLKSKNFHRMTTYGYDEFFIEGIKPKNQ